ncbi:MAG TPA: hypothetical protein VJ941_11365, partial [Gracilimonas sp.]|nr:hypothetical protein [Gracilimonas sp.]
MLLEKSPYNIRWFFRRFLLEPFGLDAENKIIFWLALFFLTLFGVGLILTAGDVLFVAFICYMTLVFVLSFIRIDISLYLFMASVMFLDQYPIPNFPSYTEKLNFFSNLKEIDYIPYFHTGMFSPAEMHLAFLTISLLLYSILKLNIRFKPIPAPLPYVGFFAVMMFAMAFGLSRGGDFLVSLWEVRALFYLALIVILVSQIISTKEQIKNLVWIFIAGSAFKAFQGVLRFIEMGFTTGGFEVLTNHEDAVFIVTILLLLIGFIIYGVRNGQRKLILLLMPVILLGFYVAQRRASYASLIVSIAVLLVILDSRRRVTFLKYFVPVAIGLFIYGAVFWNSN